MGLFGSVSTILMGYLKGHISIINSGLQSLGLHFDSKLLCGHTYSWSFNESIVRRILAIFEC